MVTRRVSEDAGRKHLLLKDTSARHSQPNLQPLNLGSSLTHSGYQLPSAVFLKNRLDASTFCQTLTPTTVVRSSRNNKERFSAIC